MTPILAYILQVPFSGWWFLAGGTVLVAGLLALVRWRRNAPEILATLAFFPAVLIVVAMCLSRGTFYELGIGWITYDDASGWYSSGINVNASNGAIWFDWTGHKEPKRWEFSEDYGWGFVQSLDSSKTYPIFLDRYSRINSDFIRKTLGFDVSWRDGWDPIAKNDKHVHILIMPQWFALLLCTPFPAWAFKRYLTRRRIRRWIRTGCCSHCSFDLRGTPPAADGSRRCSECGTVNPAPQAIPSPEPPQCTTAPPQSVDSNVAVAETQEKQT